MSPLPLSLHFLQAQPDSRLVALARAGHEPAFEAVVRRYRRELLSYCRRLQPQSENAEDALQQTLLQAWKALTAGAEVKDVRPWLFRIAHNVSLNSLRVPVAVPQEAPDAVGPLEVHQLVEQRLEARAALAGMAALPTLQRQVFVSATLGGASHEEVATALDLSSGAVRGLIYRARAAMRATAAAIIPSPAVNWAIRRAESRTAGTPAIVEVLAGGGGAGVAAALAKGGTVLTLAGAVAFAGSASLTSTTDHFNRPHGHTSRSRARGEESPGGLRASATAGALELAVTPRVAAGRTRDPGSRGARSGRRQISSEADDSSREARRGPTPGGGGDVHRSRGGAGTATGRDDGGTRLPATPGGHDGERGRGSTNGGSDSVDGSSGRSSNGGSDGGSDGGSRGTPTGSTTTRSGPPTGEQPSASDDGSSATTGTTSGAATVPSSGPNGGTSSGSGEGPGDAPATIAATTPSGSSGPGDGSPTTLDSTGRTSGSP